MTAKAYWKILSSTKLSTFFCHRIAMQQDTLHRSHCSYIKTCKTTKTLPHPNELLFVKLKCAWCLRDSCQEKTLCTKQKPTSPLAQNKTISGTCPTAIDRRWLDTSPTTTPNKQYVLVCSNRFFRLIHVTSTSKKASSHISWLFLAYCSALLSQTCELIDA